MPTSANDLPSYLNWNYTMPSLGPNGELTGGPDPYADQADPSKGVDIRNPDGTFTHMDAHKDRNGNYINPTTFMSDSLPGGVAYAYPDTDEYSHIGRVFRTDRNRSIGKMLALVGGGALAGNLMAGGAGSGITNAVGGGLDEGMGISSGFLSPATEAAMTGAGGLGGALPAAADIMTVTAPAAAGLGAAGTAGAIGAGATALSGVGGASGGMDVVPDDPSGANVMGAVPGNVIEGGGGLMSNLGQGVTNMMTNPDGSYNWGNIIKGVGGAASLLGGLTGSRAGNVQTEPTLPAGWNDPAKYQSMSRQRAPAMSVDDYATYGQSGGEHRFFTDPTYTPRGATAMVAPPAADPGPNMHLPDMRLEPIAKRAGGGGVNGPGSGREDKIDALLSDGEYVMDAESVALLGDGSGDEGSRRLDQLRANLRRHKGNALAKGKFSPAAKDPMAYMHKAGGGNVQVGVKDLPPTNSRDPAPLPNAGGNYAIDDAMESTVERRTDALDKLRKMIGAQFTEREADVLRKLGHAKGGRISRVIDTFLNAKIPAVPPRTQFTPEETASLVAWLRRNQPDSDVLKHFDTTTTPDLRGRVPPSAADIAAHGDLLNEIQNQPPVARAKGGLTLLQGGRDVADPSMRLEQLANAQRTAAALRTQKGELTPASPAIQGDRAVVEAARQRLKLIRSLADTTPSPVMKAEGGSVKDLTKFADRLEDQHIDAPDLIEQP